MRHSTNYRANDHAGPWSPMRKVTTFVVWPIVIWFVAMFIFLTTFDLVRDL